MRLLLLFGWRPRGSEKVTTPRHHTMGGDTTPLLSPSHTPAKDEPQTGCHQGGESDTSSPSHRRRKLRQKRFTDHAQRRRKLFAKFSLSSVFPLRSPPVTQDMAAGDVKHCRGNISFSLPWNRSKTADGHTVLDDIKPNKKCSLESQGQEEWPVPPPNPTHSRRRLRPWLAEACRYKTVPLDAQPLNPENPSPGPPTQAWTGPPAWPSVVHGLHSVSLLLLVTLLSPVGAFCPRDCVCDDQRLRSECVRTDLDVIPILMNPGTLELDLSHNRIKTILEGLTFYNELEYLDLSHNEVVTLGSQNFASQRSLHTLIISNNKVSRILSRAFLGLSKLTTLDLSDNYIETVENNAFGSLGKLRSLDLSNNRIKNLTVNTFMKLRGLRVLNLCKNELKYISSVIFEPLKELQDLDLCSNQITVIQDFAFESLKELAKLRLGNNKVHVVHEKAFSGLVSLRLLGLKDNAFTEVPSHALVAVKELEELDLSINPLQELPTGPFSHLTNLKTLYISRCENLSTIDSGAFTKLDRLTSLVLSFNPKLTSLHHDVFKPLSNLRHLVLRGNGLRAFDQSLVSTTSLQSLDLRDNILECNCSIKWLQEASLNNTITLKIEEISCAGPEVLQGRSLSELSEYDLECYNYVVVVASCAAASMAIVLLMVAFGVVYYKNCRKMKAMVHDNWPEKIVATWKDPEYQKQVEDDEYTFHSMRGVQHIPVTVI